MPSPLSSPLPLPSSLPFSIAFAIAMEISMTFRTSTCISNHFGSSSPQRIKSIMTNSLNDEWASWVDQQHPQIPKERFCVPLRFLERQCLPKLSKQGFQVPSTRKTLLALESGLDKLEVLTNRHGPQETRIVTWYNFLNLVWEPIIEQIEHLVRHNLKPSIPRDQQSCHRPRDEGHRFGCPGGLDHR